MYCWNFSLFAQLYFGPVLLSHSRHTLLLSLYLLCCLINFKFSTLMDLRCAFREICLTGDLCPLRDTLVIIVTPFHEKCDTQHYCSTPSICGRPLDPGVSRLQSRALIRQNLLFLVCLGECEAVGSSQHHKHNRDHFKGLF